MIKLLQSIFLLLLFVVANNSFSQYSEKEQYQIDSLSSVISNSEKDLDVVRAYADLYGILHIQNIDTIIEEVKGNRQAVGKTENPKPFTTHSVQLHKGDQIYLFSDGFADQFGGEKGKKMMHKRFKSLLISIKEEELETQKNKIDSYFKDWMGTHEQIDDVCIIGVKI